MLSFVETSFRYSAVARAGRDQLYAADAAMEAAIARRNAGGPCGDFSTDKVNGIAVEVTCEPAPRPPPPPVEPAPSPAHAILTLGTSPLYGLHQVNGSGPVVVRGDVFSHSVVANESDEPLQVQGKVGAKGSCTGDLSASSVACGQPTAPADPAYPSDLTAVPARKEVPPCPQGPLVSLEPGYYDDAPGLSLLTAGGCAGKLVWFRPGVYYFNFHFSSSPASCEANPTPCTWFVNDPAVNVVGGEPRGWDPEGLTARPAIDFPGGCRTDEAGVQFVFGGRSRVVQAAGKVDLCPRVGRAGPPITVYGLAQGTATERASIVPASTAATSVPGFLGPENAKAVDEQPARLTAEAALTSALPAPSTITMSGYAALPAGSRMAALTLRVTHRETNDVGPLSAAVTVGGTAVPGSPFTVPRCGERVRYCDDRLVLTGLVAPEKLSSLVVTYSAAPPTGEAKVGTESLDGIVVEARYTPPALEALSGCLQRPDDPATAAPEGCPLLKTVARQDGVARSFLWVGGTVYAPTAAVDLDLADVDAPALNRGVVSAGLRLKIAPKATYSGLIVALPQVIPKQAVLALRAEGDEGLLQAAESGRVVVRGDVVSHARVANTSTSPLRIEGRLAAVGACTGMIEVHPPPDETTTPARRCAPSGPSRTETGDPVYPPAVQTAMEGPDRPRRTVPGCAGQDGVVRLLPGYYDDARALSRLTDGSGCPAQVVWLQPGAYYFDFNFADPAACDADADLCTWRISDPDVHLVGGDPSGWSTTQPPQIPLPGGCRTDTSGVQLLFGGRSRMLQSAGRMELCPIRTSQLAPPIPIYGLTRGAANERVRSFPATESTAVGFSNPANARDIEEEPPRRTADTTSPVLAALATITLDGFDVTVPEGSRLHSATVRIAHRESALTGARTISVVNGQGTVLAAGQVPACPAFCETRVPLERVTSPAQLAGLRATYQVTLAGLPAPTASLDGIEVEVAYTPPALEALSGCLVVLGANGCPLLKAEGAARIVLNGTVYAPTALVDLDVDALSSPLVNDGVIIGTLRVDVTPAACYTGPAISHLDAQFPSAPPEAGDVLTACIGDTPVLRARVTFPSAMVQTWSVLK